MPKITFLHASEKFTDSRLHFTDQLYLNACFVTPPVSHMLLHAFTMRIKFANSVIKLNNSYALDFTAFWANFHLNQFVVWQIRINLSSADVKIGCAMCARLPQSICLSLDFFFQLAFNHPKN